MNNKQYKFYGSNSKKISPINKEYLFIKDQYHLYDLLSHIWCVYSCAPRMRDKWSIDNKTVGQCSITSFLVQDIFGGEVYGVELDDGNFHCYNVIGDVLFDLTSEQFEGKVLEYKLENLQTRDVHFKSNEKYLRYLYLKNELLKLKK